MFDHYRCAGIGGIALVREVKRCGALAADDHSRLVTRVDEIEHLLSAGLHRKYRDRHRPNDPHRSAGAERRSGNSNGASGQMSISQMSGT